MNILVDRLNMGVFFFKPISGELWTLVMVVAACELVVVMLYHVLQIHICFLLFFNKPDTKQDFTLRHTY